MIPVQKVLQLFGVMRASNAIGTKRPASRDQSGGAVRQTHHMREIERLTATDCWKNQQNPNKSSLYDVKQNRQRPEGTSQTLLANDCFHPLDTR